MRILILFLTLCILSMNVYADNNISSFPKPSKVCEFISQKMNLSLSYTPSKNQEIFKDGYVCGSGYAQAFQVKHLRKPIPDLGILSYPIMNYYVGGTKNNIDHIVIALFDFEGMQTSKNLDYIKTIAREVAKKFSFPDVSSRIGNKKQNIDYKNYSVEIEPTDKKIYIRYINKNNSGIW